MVDLVPGLDVEVLESTPLRFDGMPEEPVLAQASSGIKPWRRSTASK